MSTLLHCPFVVRRTHCRPVLAKARAGRSLVLAALAVLFAAGGTQAAQVFDLKSPVSKVNAYPSSTTWYREYNYASGALTLNVTGWSYQSGVIAQDWVGLWDGLGVEYAGSPNHAIDNESGDYDMLLLSFSTPVALTDLNLGWTYNDSDMSLLALTGNGSTAFTGKLWQDLLSAGWVSAGNYRDVAQNPDVNPGGIVAKYWLVGAANPNLGSQWLGGNVNITSGTDYMKLSTVTAVIPEPSTMVTVGLALCAMASVLRRRR